MLLGGVSGGKGGGRSSLGQWGWRFFWCMSHCKMAQAKWGARCGDTGVVAFCIFSVQVENTLFHLSTIVKLPLRMLLCRRFGWTPMEQKGEWLCAAREPPQRHPLVL